MLQQYPRYNHILLADDDEDDRVLFRDALREVHNEFELAEVENGEDLMGYLNEKARPLPDVLFLDLNMPLKNGYECISEIRASRQLQQLPIIILSTTSLDEQLQRMLRRHTCSYIKKPGSYLELKNALKKTIAFSHKGILIQE